MGPDRVHRCPATTTLNLDRKYYPVASSTPLNPPQLRVQHRHHPHLGLRILGLSWFLVQFTDNMATRTLEARFEHLTVNDENDPGDGTQLYQKKVSVPPPFETGGS